MLVSHTHQFAFIHIYKTAGTSVAKSLAPFNVSRPKRKIANALGRLRLPFPKQWHAGLSVEHKTAVEARERLTPAVFDAYFTFAFVRNPWDWQVSVYSYVMSHEEHPQHPLFCKLESFERYVLWLCENGEAAKDNRRQCDFLCDSNGRQLVDFVGRFESLATDFDSVSRRIGVSAQLPRLNASVPRPDYRQFYTDATAELIGTKYAADVDRFGYDFDRVLRGTAAA